MINMKINIFHIKALWMWIYHNLILRYWQFRYRTTVMTLARLTLLVLAKETVVPMVYWMLVLIGAIGQYQPLTEILDVIKVACVPSTAEIIIAILAVMVLLIVTIFEYLQERKKRDLFTQIYVPYTDGILEYMDAEHYHDWTYSLAVAGNTMVHEDQLYKLEDLVLYLKSRVKHREYTEIDSLYDNLAMIVDDVLHIVNSYGSNRRSDGMVTIEKFYKKGPYNPNYDDDLQRYKDIVIMLSDLVFEQTRLLNLILKRMRSFMPDYQVEAGKLMTDSVVYHNEYREDEETSSPYPGLKGYMIIRSTRNYHIGSGMVAL